MQLQHAVRLLNDTCALRHLALNTQKTYAYWLGRYASFLKDPKLKLLTPEQKLQAFLTHLALTGISASTQNQAFNALLFFYRDVLKAQLGPVDALRAKRPAALRHCPDREDVFKLLVHVPDIYGYPTRLIVHLLYGCGLRVCEPLNLRIKDIDLKQRRLYVHQSKGNKGRVVLFPDCLAPALELQLALARARAAQDKTNNIPVALPGLLAKKYPYAARSERWAWLFPSHTLCRDPRAATPTLVRWRCHQANVQRAVKAAAEFCHLEGITPHSLRHAYATHALQGGAFVRDVQVVLGHNSLETTMLYLHTEAGRVASPLLQYLALPSRVTAADLSLGQSSIGPVKGLSTRAGLPANNRRTLASSSSFTPPQPVQDFLRQRFAPVSSHRETGGALTTP